MDESGQVKVSDQTCSLQVEANEHGTGSIYGSVLVRVQCYGQIPQIAKLYCIQRNLHSCTFWLCQRVVIFFGQGPSSRKRRTFVTVNAAAVVPVCILGPS